MSDEIKNLIQESFLRDEAKRELLRLLELGDWQNFWPAFNQSLIEELQKRQNRTNEVIEKYEKELKKMENDFVKESEKLQNYFNEQSLNVSTVDLKTKEEIWEKYYSAREELQKSFKQKMSQTLQTILLTEDARMFD